MEVNKIELSINELLEENTFEGIDGAKLVFQEFEIYDKPTFIE